ncbi:MAG TPA: hypothetical protein VJ835_05265 [Fimbriimonadaceae bacterium]|nr:hypothetical protein [Fimbriimonadaceae bacterium]
MSKIEEQILTNFKGSASRVFLSYTIVDEAMVDDITVTPNVTRVTTGQDIPISHSSGFQILPQARRIDASSHLSIGDECAEDTLALAQGAIQKLWPADKSW